MNFMDNMKKKVTTAGQATVQKAKDVSEVTRLNGTISSTEGKINALYQQVGYAVYCAERENPRPELAEQMRQLDELHQTVQNCQERIKQIHASSTCPGCGAHIKPGMAFCSSCGCRLPQMTESKPAARFCPGCGATLADDCVFCTTCGMRVTEETPAEETEPRACVDVPMSEDIPAAMPETQQPENSDQQ